MGISDIILVLLLQTFSRLVEISFNDRLNRNYDKSPHEGPYFSLERLVLEIPKSIVRKLFSLKKERRLVIDVYDRLGLCQI